MRDTLLRECMNSTTQKESETKRIIESPWDKGRECSLASQQAATIKKKPFKPAGRQKQKKGNMMGRREGGRGRARTNEVGGKDSYWMLSYFNSQREKYTSRNIAYATSSS